MALSISLDLNNTGSPATYWVINSIHIDFVQGAAQVVVDGYVSSDGYAAGDAPLASVTFNTSILNRTTMATPITNIQNYILANNPLFSGASVVA